MSFRSIKGTFDVLPDAYDVGGSTVHGSAAWRWAEGVVRDVMRRFNMEEIRTPVFEPVELVARGVGGTTDIVQKEMFAFTKGSTDYVLRPEVTAPVMRAYLQHNLQQRGGVQKLFYIAPCFRAERPQKGRFRQFHQFGIELIGSAEPRADAEAIACMMAVYRAFGIDDTRLRINTLGDAESRPRYREALRDYFAPYADELSETSRKRLDTNPLRILDTKNPKEQEFVAEAPVLLDYVDDESRAHYDTVKGLLSDLDIAFEEAPRLVRGLDYYTRTVFELESPALGAQSALGAGGRYDGLAEVVGSKRPVPAVGFAAGFERLFLALEAAGTMMPEANDPAAFLVGLGDAAERWTFATAERLRRQGLRVGLDLKGRSLGSQMKEADRQGARYAVIVGEDELDAEAAQVKDMQTGEQQSVPFADLAERLTTSD